VEIRWLGDQEEVGGQGRAGDNELKLHLMVTVSARRPSKMDYDGIAAVIKQIPRINLVTPPEESRGSKARVNPPVVTIQTTPPQSSSHARNTVEYPRHSSHTGTKKEIFKFT
jgi:hypothetical protein